MNSQITISKNERQQLSMRAGKIYRATDKKGNHYCAKVMKKQSPQKSGYSQCIESNLQILRDLQYFIFKEHLLYIVQELSNENLYAFVTQVIDVNLEQYIKNNKVFEQQARNIFSQIVKAVYSLIMNGYWHRNIRVEHFVKVKDIWKLQSLVFDEDTSKCGDQYNQYLWDPIYQPPEFNPQKKKYTDNDYNLMTVWNLGCILLFLLTGKHNIQTKQIRNKCKDKNFTMQNIIIVKSFQNNLSSSILQILCQMLHHNPAKRMKLKSVFQNPLISQQVSMHCLKGKQIKIYNPIISQPTKLPKNQNEKDAIIQTLIEQLDKMKLISNQKNEAIKKLNQKIKILQNKYQNQLSSMSKTIGQLNFQLHSSKIQILEKQKLIQQLNKSMHILSKIQIKQDSIDQSFSIFQKMMDQKNNQFSLDETTKQCNNCNLLKQQIKKHIQSTSKQDQQIRNVLKMRIKKLQADKNKVEKQKINYMNMLDEKESQNVELKEEIFNLKKKLKRFENS